MSLCAAPAYSQEIRAGSVADSICSPATMTVMLNSGDKEAGVSSGVITVYVITARGYMYIAEL